MDELRSLPPPTEQRPVAVATPAIWGGAATGGPVFGAAPCGGPVRLGAHPVFGELPPRKDGGLCL